MAETPESQRLERRAPDKPHQVPRAAAVRGTETRRIPLGARQRGQALGQGALVPFGADPVPDLLHRAVGQEIVDMPVEPLVAAEVAPDAPV